MNENVLPIGKIETKLLSSLLQKLPSKKDEVVIPPAVGFDAAGIKVQEGHIAVSCDPITFAHHRICTYSIAININDVACLGCCPKWFSSNIFLPQGTTERELVDLWQEFCQALDHYNVTAVTGHTEVTPAVNSPIIAGHMIGVSIGETMLNPRNAKPGDSLFMIRGAALEGTSVLAHERKEEVKRFVQESTLERMLQFIDDPGVCIWPLVQSLLPWDSVIALHDTTEGGVITALHELASACACGMELDIESIPILPETEELSHIFRFNPLALLASGSLLMVGSPDLTPQMIQEKTGESTVVKIGTLTSSKEVIAIRGMHRSPLPEIAQDALIGALEREVPSDIPI